MSEETDKMRTLLRTVWRCEHTGNECGTDTMAQGFSCGCSSCCAWLEYAASPKGMRDAARRTFATLIDRSPDDPMPTPRGEGDE